MGNDIMVSIICNAYNHEDYIKDALDGFIMQKTNFKFEVLIHDDASMDGTADIIREYEKKYPELIKPIYQSENQYSKRTGMVGRIQRARVKGKYTALCEGDDYWTDSFKLQKQFDVMEAHPEIDICAHAADMIDAKTKKCINIISPASKNTILSADEVIRGGGGYVVTSSLFYRSCIDREMPKFRQKLQLDYFIQIHGSLKGGMIFLSDNMSVYRANSKGSWTSKMAQNKDKALRHYKRVNEILAMINQDTRYKYNNAICEAILQNEFDMLIRGNRYAELKREPYATIYKKLPKQQRFKLLLKQYIPILRK